LENNQLRTEMQRHAPHSGARIGFCETIWFFYNCE